MIIICQLIVVGLLEGIHSLALAAVANLTGSRVGSALGFALTLTDRIDAFVALFAG